MSFDATKDTTNVALLAIELLHGGLENLSRDREAATQLITRACSVLENAGSATHDNSGVRSGLAVWQIRKVKAYIDANIEKSVTVSDLSALVRLGASHFQRTFKKSFGVSPHAFLMERRIHRAQTLMLTTQDSLSAIALAAGFADQAHFTSRFRQATGVTPRVWRRERQECGNTEQRPNYTEPQRNYREARPVRTKNDIQVRLFGSDALSATAA